MVLGQGTNQVPCIKEEHLLCHGAGVGASDQNFGNAFGSFSESV
jgi:hypothetical protein